jgi:replicative DNA helicase
VQAGIETTNPLWTSGSVQEHRGGEQVDNSAKATAKQDLNVCLLEKLQTYGEGGTNVSTLGEFYRAEQIPLIPQSPKIDEARNRPIGGANSTNSTYSTIPSGNEPTPIGSNLPDIPASILPGWAGEFAKELSLFLQVPAGLVVMQTLASISACTAHKFSISPGGDYFGYVEPHIGISACGVADVGGKKTEIVKKARAPITQWESEQAKKLISKKTDSDRQNRIIDVAILKLEENAAKEFDPAKQQRILDQIKAMESTKLPPVVLPNIWLANVTDEGLQQALIEHGHTAILADEGGIYDVLAGMYSGGPNGDTYLQAHAGIDLKIKRQRDERFVKDPAISAGLCVQPGVIADLVRNEGKKRLKEKGLYARFAYCVPAAYVGGRDVKNVKPMRDAVVTDYAQGIHNLLNIKGDDRRRLVLNAEAYALWLDFYQEIENDHGVGSENEAITEWTSKLHGLCLRCTSPTMSTSWRTIPLRYLN